MSGPWSRVKRITKYTRYTKKGNRFSCVWQPVRLVSGCAFDLTGVFCAGSTPQFEGPERARFYRLFGLVAQSVEQRPFKPLVLGSSPSQPTTLIFIKMALNKDEMQ